MADLIEKIGRFFADQEAQIQGTYTQVTQAPVRARPRPPPPVHKIPTPVSAPSPVFEHRAPPVKPVPKLSRKNSLIRRQLSFKSTVESGTRPLQSSQCPVERINQILNEVRQQSKARDIPPLNSSKSLSRNTRHPDDIWNRELSGDVLSWASSSPPASTNCSSSRDEDRSQTCSDVNERPRKPRPPQQKIRKRLRKKKRGVSKHSGNQESDQPDPKLVAKENAEKVAAALEIAQERAKRFLQDQLQLDRERELERHEAELRVQEQMMRIELVRARSFRQPSSSTMTTARSSLSEVDNLETESICTEDMAEPPKPPSEFMAELESQLREKMALEMLVKQSCIEKHKQRERVRLKLDKVLQQNAVRSSKVARLAAMKASLEMELTAVLDDTDQTRQQRRDLELADEKERLRRQREAERALQVRLREEEWSSMMEDEKARSQVAAEARAKASKRVGAHSVKLRKELQAYRYELRHSTTNGLSSSIHSDNNDGDYDDNESPRTEGPAQPFKMKFILPPELAEFEEDGISKDSKCSIRTTNNSDLKMPNNNDSTKAARMATNSSFRWQVPQFSDQTKFTQTLDELVSDDEE